MNFNPLLILITLAPAAATVIILLTPKDKTMAVRITAVIATGIS